LKKLFFNRIFFIMLLLLPINTLIAQQNDLAAEVDVPLGGSIERIVAFYNQYANEVKNTGRITVIKNLIRKVDMQIPLILRPFMPREMNGPFGNQNITITESFINGEGTDDTTLRLNNFLPVNERPFVSRLLASHVLSANCARQGSNFVVTIRLKDEPFDVFYNNMPMDESNNENMSDAEREILMNNMLTISGYVSSMDLGFSDMRRTERQGRHPSPPNGAFSRMEGGFQNGTIIAIFNQRGQLTLLTHSFEMNMNAGFLGMKVEMNSSTKQEYQFIYPN